MSTQHPDLAAEDFGANEWLIEELYEQYRADKDSVDPSWREFFAEHDAEGGGTRTGAPTANGATRKPPAKPDGAQRPSQAQQESSGRASVEARRQDGSGRVPRDRASGTAEQSRATDRGEAAQDDRTDLPPAPPVSAVPGSTAYRKPDARLATAEEGPTEDSTEKLRGVAARTATNMESSLEIPVATSVRAVPAKLMADNRTVINNHLSRSRGGKVSFTHLIGYAMVEALAEVPEMNYSYRPTDNGKPG
ncbi:2-oxo acid dehydrogenase subunit E2, partial [Georgenia sp. 10Sc9-8]|nr:2-oxo acid dehydrogenase subunit E2 [Georgenia halotolerans]